MFKNVVQKMIKILPNKMNWSIHNIIGHPISEILALLGFEKLANNIHDNTVPENFTSEEEKTLKEIKERFFK